MPPNQGKSIWITPPNQARTLAFKAQSRMLASTAFPSHSCPHHAVYNCPAGAPTSPQPPPQRLRTEALNGLCAEAHQHVYSLPLADLCSECGQVLRLWIWWPRPITAPRTNVGSSARHVRRWEGVADLRASLVCPSVTHGGRHPALGVGNLSQQPLATSLPPVPPCTTRSHPKYQHKDNKQLEIWAPISHSTPGMDLSAGGGGGGWHDAMV